MRAMMMILNRRMKREMGMKEEREKLMMRRVCVRWVSLGLRG